MNHHVVVDELCRPRRIGEDAADGAGDEKDVVRSVRAEPIVDRRLIAKVELIASRGQDALKPELLQPSKNRGTDQAPMAGNENSRR
jgi:hypothetical protein